MTRFLAILALLLFSGQVFGTTFDCREIFAAAFSELTGEESPVLVTATINADGETGSIEVADRKFKATYQVEGLDRTWRFFTAKGQEHGYLFLIQPDGTAGYYDHEISDGEPTYPHQVYFCSERTGSKN